MILNYKNSKNIEYPLYIGDKHASQKIYHDGHISYADISFSKQRPYDIKICDNVLREYDWDKFLKQVEYEKIYTKGNNVDYLVFEIECITQYINVIMFYRFVDMIEKLIGLNIFYKLNYFEPQKALEKFLGNNSFNFILYRDKIMNGNIDWKNEAKILRNKLVKDNQNDILNDMIKVIDSYLHNPTDVYYRGVGFPIYPEIPSIFRLNEGRDETKIYKDMMVRYPHVFKGNSTIETLTHMQHFELKTRMLDVSTNPLVALYMAVNKIYTGDPEQLYYGEVIVYFTDVNSVKYYDSYKVMINSKLIFLSSDEKKDLFYFIKKLDNVSKKLYDKIKNLIWDNEKLTRTLIIDIISAGNINNFHFDEFEIDYGLRAYYKLLNIIRKDIPAFSNKIDLKSLLKAYVVNVGYVNERIAAQSGGFILFGLDKNYLTSRQSQLGDIISTRNIRAIPRIIIKNKIKIYEELIALGINDSTMIPDIEHASKFILDKYK